MPTSHPVVQLLLTGNEIMSGDTVDSNSAMIAQRLAELGLVIRRKVTVGDDQDLLREEVAAISSAADVLIINGGLGPTVDDLTAQVLAEAAGVPLREHAGALAHLKQWCARRNLPLNDANFKQAMLPRGAAMIENLIGSAVGIQMELNGCLLICTPGVPGELRPMLDPIMETLSKRFGLSSRVEVVRLQTFGMGEATAQQIIDDGVEQWPEGVALGFRAGAPQVEVKLTITGPSHRPQLEYCKQRIHELLGSHIIGEGDIRLAQRVVELLRQQGKMLTTAESCTGGQIAAMLTGIPGASAVFQAGFVSYADQIKSSVLGVDQDVLAEHGAVSEPVARQMAQGAMVAAAADYAIAVTGIAGPDGGTEEKPVGTVWLAWGSREKLQTRCLCWPVERSLFQTLIAAAGLDMIRRSLLGVVGESHYFFQRGAGQHSPHPAHFVTVT